MTYFRLKKQHCCIFIIFLLIWTLYEQFVLEKQIFHTSLSEKLLFLFSRKSFVCFGIVADFFSQRGTKLNNFLTLSYHHIDRKYSTIQSHYKKISLIRMHAGMLQRYTEKKFDIRHKHQTSCDKEITHFLCIYVLGYFTVLYCHQHREFFLCFTRNK